VHVGEQGEQEGQGEVRGWQAAGYHGLWVMGYGYGGAYSGKKGEYRREVDGRGGWV